MFEVVRREGSGTRRVPHQRGRSAVRDAVAAVLVAVLVAVGAGPASAGKTRRRPHAAVEHLGGGRHRQCAGRDVRRRVRGRRLLPARPGDGVVGSAVSPSGAPAPARPFVDGTVTAAAPDGADGSFIRGDDLLVDGVERRGVQHIRRGGRLDPGYRSSPTGRSASSPGRGRRCSSGAASQASTTSHERAGRGRHPNGKILPWDRGSPVTTSSGDPRIESSRSRVTVQVYSRYGSSSVGKRPQDDDRRRRPGGASAAVQPPPERHRLGDHPRRGAPCGVSRRRLHAVDGTDRTGLAAVDARSGRLTKWDPDCDGTVLEVRVAPAGSPVYIAGEFASVGGKSRRGLAGVDAGVVRRRPGTRTSAGLSTR